MSADRHLTPVLNKTNSALNVKPGYVSKFKKDQVVLTEEEQKAFDEEREEELLRIAAEKKARAVALKARQDKMLMAIAEKKEAANKAK